MVYKWLHVLSLPEKCDAHENFKQMIIQAKKEDIVYVKSRPVFPEERFAMPLFKRQRTGKSKNHKLLGV